MAVEGIEGCKTFAAFPMGLWLHAHVDGFLDPSEVRSRGIVGGGCKTMPRGSGVWCRSPDRVRAPRWNHPPPIPPPTGRSRRAFSLSLSPRPVRAHEHAGHKRRQRRSRP